MTSPGVKKRQTFQISTFLDKCDRNSGTIRDRKVRKSGGNLFQCSFDLVYTVLSSSQLLAPAAAGRAARTSERAMWRPADHVAPGAIPALSWPHSKQPGDWLCGLLPSGRRRGDLGSAHGARGEFVLDARRGSARCVGGSGALAVVWWWCTIQQVKIS